MSALTDAIAKLESGGSSINGPAGGYANYRYQQFPGFVSQYGFGEAGINNYASQVLQANPNATFGDLYGGYVTGTGNPASASMSSLLTTTQPGAQGAYSNLINNSPIAPNTPLSSLLGSNDAGSGNLTSADANAFDSYTSGSGLSYPNAGGLGTNDPSLYSYGGMGSIDTTPSPGAVNSDFSPGMQTIGQTNYGMFGEGFNNPGGSSTDQVFPPVQSDAQSSIANSDPIGSGVGDLVAGSGGDAGNTGNALAGGSGMNIPGLGIVGNMLGGGANGPGSGDTTFFTWLSDWAIRAAVIFLGFVFVVAGLYMLKGNLVLKEMGPIGKVAKAGAKAAA